MELTIASQTWMFLLSILVGAVLGVCYDAFRILRLAVQHPSGVVVIEDVLYAVICAVVSFGYLLVMDCGEIRLFVLVGELIGAVLYFCTLSVLLIAVSKQIISAIKWFFTQLYRIFLAPIVRFFKYIFGKITLSYDFFAKRVQNKVKTSQNHLKKPNCLLYTLYKQLRQDRDTGKTEEHSNS